MEPQDKRARAFVLIACMGVMFMTAVEGTIVATAMPTVAGALGGYSLFGWTFAAYLLTQAATIPIYGRLADLHGRKPMFFVGASAFIAGSAVCGAAPSMLVLILGRAIQGLGAGGIVPVAQTIIGDTFTPAERARIQGYLSSMWGISAIIGPVLGAAMVEHLSWPVIFWFNVPLALAVMAMIAVLFREQRRRTEHRIDVVGAILLVVAVGGLLLCLMQASHLGGLLGPVLAVTAVAFVLFALHERRTPEPLLPVALWTNRVIRTCNLGSLGIGASTMGVTVFLPTYIQGVLGRDAYAAGTTLAFMSIGWPVASAFAGRLMLRTTYRTTAISGGIVLVVGSIVLAMIDPDRGIPWASAASFLIGCGLGLLNSPFMVALQDAAPWQVRGIATASNAFNRMLGAALGTAVLGAALNWRLAGSGAGADDPVQALIDPARRAQLEASLAAALSAEVADALRVTFVVAAVVAVAAACAGYALPRGTKPSSTPRRPS
jgi:EmrB/QacA subfamily drug resistance transporter